MDTFANKVTSFFLHLDLIDDGQVEWCRYSLQTIFTNIIGFLLLMVIGLFLAPWPQVLLLNLGVAFLRTKAGGLHMPTAMSCFIVSLLFECGCLLVLPFMFEQAAILIFAVSILMLFRFAPCNNQAIHCDAEELSLMKRELHIRLITFSIVALVLIVLSPMLAYAIVMSTVVVSLSVVLSKMGVGIR